MAEWKKYEGTDKQREEMKESIYGVIPKYSDGKVGPVFNFRPLEYVNEKLTHYLICERNPHHDKIIEWARTGRPVEIEAFTGRWVPCRRPIWNVEDNYRFAEPKAE